MRRALFVALLSVAACGGDASTLGNGSSSGQRTGTSGGSGTSGTSGSSGTSGDTASGGTSGTSGSSDGSAAQICVDSINKYRTAKGLTPYTRWTDMESCADGQATSDGSSTAAHGAFGKCGEVAQNECPGWPGPAETMIPQCLMAMYGEGPGGGHYEAMLSTKYTKVSCGFGNGQGGIWAVQNFH